jgi:hypothetical protein
MTERRNAPGYSRTQFREQQQQQATGHCLEDERHQQLQSAWCTDNGQTTQGRQQRRHQRGRVREPHHATQVQFTGGGLQTHNEDNKERQPHPRPRGRPRWRPPRHVPRSPSRACEARTAQAWRLLQGDPWACGPVSSSRPEQARRPGGRGGWACFQTPVTHSPRTPPLLRISP